MDEDAGDDKPHYKYLTAPPPRPHRYSVTVSQIMVVTLKLMTSI
jgi:hypothetical protein